MAGAHVRPSLFLESLVFQCAAEFDWNSSRFIFIHWMVQKQRSSPLQALKLAGGPTRNELFICCKRGMWYTLNGKQVWCTEEDSGYLLGPCACSIIVCAAHIFLQASCAGVQDLGLTLAGDKCRSSCRSCYYRVWPLNPRLHRDAVVQPQPCNRARLLLLPRS